jgi:putative heme iron utilization protein
MNEHSPFHSIIDHLLSAQRVASLGTIDDEGFPHVSMVPFASLSAQGKLLIHISSLSPHFSFLKSRPQVALLIMKAEVAGEEVHALPRVSVQATAEFVGRESENYEAARAAYVHRFPEAAFMTDLGDFAFVAITPISGRVIAGFGAAKKVDGTTLMAAIQAA